MEVVTQEHPDTSTARFWRFWVATGTTRLGSAISTVAMPLVALVTLQASPLQLGLIAASANVAWLVIGLPAGVIVERLPLKATQVSLDLLRGIALASIPVAWLLGVLSVTQLILVSLVMSFATVLFDVANSVFLPSIVPSSELQKRNSLMSGTDAAMSMAGPSLGGLLVQLFGAVLTTLADAFSYLISGLLLWSIPSSKAPRRVSQTPMRTAIAEGWRYVIRHPVMGPCMWSATAINFVCGAQLTLFPLYLVHELNTPASLIGLLLATEGVGALIGATLCTRLVQQLGSARSCLLAGLFAVAGAALIPCGSGATGWLLFALGNALFAAGVVVFSTTTRTYRQLASPPELLSRVMATVRFVSWGALPLGSLAAGLVASASSPRALLLALVVGTALAPIFLLLSPARSARDFEDVQPTG
ncbi:MFS family permease [Psychromicrobium silvestre]|uniref:MFS family permease n=1 Tax=Psychromicrobium silvestre TaxID=1645614 RepID=A0A7Y9S3J8_9MICC|nr:MFS transporter [Psychromicrobium silvestre]NYE93903.1 MFS family permease [Psychromicrobium silvestre]